MKTFLSVYINDPVHVFVAVVFSPTPSCRHNLYGIHTDRYFVKHFFELNGPESIKGYKQHNFNVDYSTITCTFSTLGPRRYSKVIKRNHVPFVVSSHSTEEDIILVKVKNLDVLTFQKPKNVRNCSRSRVCVPDLHISLTHNIFVLSL